MWLPATPMIPSTAGRPFQELAPKCGLLVYHLVCELKIRQIRQASKAWREERTSLVGDSQTLPPSTKNS
jgi:hypothetical protein